MKDSAESTVVSSTLEERERLIAEAVGFLEETHYWIARFNEVSAVLWSLGYNQMPEAEDVSGYAKAKSTAGSTIFISKDWLQKIPGQEPEALHPAHIQEYSRPSPSSGKNHSRVIPKPKVMFSEKRKQFGEKQGWVCAYCSVQGTPEHGPDLRQWHLDHIFPKSADGDDMDDNLVLSCATCNLKKHARSALAFFRLLSQERINA